MKTVVTAVISAVIGFGVGMFIAMNRATTPASAADVPLSGALSVLSEENRRLEAEWQQLSVDVDSLNAANAMLIAEREKREAAPSGGAGRIIGFPLQRYEIQEAVLNNLRNFAAAQDHYKLEHGRWPSSINDLVDATNYIRRIMPVDGEDYANLLWGGRTFRLTTRSGVTIAYANDEPVDSSLPEFHIDYPPEVTLARELEKKVADAKQAATESYRLANRGKNPPNEKVLIAFFDNPEEGADFVEYLEAKKRLPED